MDDYCKSGNLTLFKSMKSQGYPFNRNTCKIAAENGHLEIIEWILAEIQEWQVYETVIYYDWISNQICPAAARKVHLHILKSMPSDITWHPAVEAALQSGQIEVLKWFHERNYIDTDESSAICNAAKSGKTDIVLWLQKEYNIQSCSFDAPMARAIETGNLEMVKYFKKAGAELAPPICAKAALHGQFEILKWMHENGCNWNYDTTTNAAIHGNLSILQWLVEVNCPTNFMFIKEGAIKGGNLQIMQWIQSNLNFTWTSTVHCKMAISCIGIF